ncbi:MAG: AsnC family transcriptional regulator [Nitrososphaerota archaeon]|jgi:DNA-binding Lrp family transcriptional regulator|nr:AsnC family transcriptional regulator [Nitrososphaerota archaeon]
MVTDLPLNNAVDGRVNKFHICMLDDTDKHLLQLLQEDFPLVESPWRELSEKLGVPEQHVLSRVKNLYATGVIRKLGPVFDLSKTDYNSTTLVALRVPDDKIDNVASIINVYSNNISSAVGGNVSHNYEREHEYNVWFTLAAKSKQELTDILNEILQKAGLSQNDVLNLPTVKRFKINVNFLVNTVATADGALGEFGFG